MGRDNKSEEVKFLKQIKLYCVKNKLNYIIKDNGSLKRIHLLNDDIAVGTIYFVFGAGRLSHYVLGRERVVTITNIKELDEHLNNPTNNLGK